MSKALLFLYVLVLGLLGVLVFNAKGYEYGGVILMTISGVLFLYYLWRALEDSV